MIELFRSACRVATSPIRQSPAYLLIGAQKAGTTSLFEHLVSHPQVVTPRRKELHYFDRPRSVRRPPYRSHFPILRAGVVTGEATPYLLFHPMAAERVARALPGVLLIAVLRDPVERAWSHYRMERHRGERRPFEEAVFDTALVDSQDRRLRDGHPGPFFEHQHRSYLRRGEYFDQLGRWLSVFERSQMVVVDFADLTSSPHAVANHILERLGLAALANDVVLGAHNVGDPAPLDPTTRRRLRNHYRRHDEALEDLLGRRFSWMRDSD